MHNFRELQVWQRAIRLVKRVYELVAQIPLEEKYGLTSQIKRSAISIPSNIAEGSSRESNKDHIRFLRIAIGSAFELETQLIIAKELELATNNNDLEDIISEIVEIQKMIAGFEKKLTNEMTMET